MGPGMGEKSAAIDMLNSPLTSTLLSSTHVSLLRGALQHVPRGTLLGARGTPSLSHGAARSRALSTSTRTELLRGALEHVPRHGWSDAALVASASHRSLSPAVVGLCPRGPVELVEHFVEQSNRELALALAARSGELGAMAPRDVLRLAVRLRLEMLTPVLNTWPQALLLQGLPPNAPRALSQAALMLDEVWRAAGDRSTDHGWYVKRALLAGVYGSTELFMVADMSPACRDTWAFLDRRLDDSLACAGAIGAVESAAGLAAAGGLVALRKL